MLKYFRSDYYRMTGDTLTLKSIPFIFIKHNLKYVFYFRIAQNTNIKLIKRILRIRLYLLGRKYGIEILPDTPIGPGLYIGHPYNITINQNSIIGKNVNIMKGATIGMENRGKRQGCPKIGNLVYIGINSTIVGNITIGNNVLISPNTFVNVDVPDNSIVIGNPCKIISKKYATQDYINFLVK